MKLTAIAVCACAMAASLAVHAQRATREPPKRAQSTPPPAPPAPRVERPVPFAVGETLTYDVSWSNLLTAGTLVSKVEEKKPSYNATAYYIVAEGRPGPLLSKLYTLYYKIDTLIDAFTLLPQRGSIYSEEGKRHHLGTTLFDRPAQRASFEYKTTTVARSEFAIPPATQDGLSALYVMRAIALKAGDRMTMPVTDSGENYRAQLEVAKPEVVTVPYGALPAWRLNVALTDAARQPVGHNTVLWISTDPRRLPLKVQGEMPVGSFTLSLRDAK